MKKLALAMVDLLSLLGSLFAQQVQITEQDKLMCQVISEFLSKCYVVCNNPSNVEQVVQEFDMVLQSIFGITDWYERKSIRREFIYACQASCYNPKFKEAMIEGHLYDAFYDECIDSLIESRS